MCEVSDVSGTCYLNDRAAYVHTAEPRIIEGRWNAATSSRPYTSAARAWPTYVHRASFQALAWIPRSMLAAAHHIYRPAAGSRREAPCTPSHRAFVYTTHREAYWESGTLGRPTAKPNARCTLCTPSLGHLVHRVSAAVGLLIATTEMVE